jgi:hypothetical protein
MTSSPTLQHQSSRFTGGLWLLLILAAGAAVL